MVRPTRDMGPRSILTYGLGGTYVGTPVTPALDDLTDVDAPTPTDGDVLTFDSGSGDWINATPTGGGGGGAAFCGARVYNSTTQNISNVTITPLTFDSEDYDTDAIHAGGSPTRLTIPSGKAGKWRFVGGTGWDTNAAGTRYLWFRKNGADVPGGGFTTSPSSASSVAQVISIDLDLIATDYVEIVGYQDSGGTRTVSNTGGDTKYRAWMAASLLAGTGGGLSPGTSFPGSPATSDMFFRTDRGLIYYYDGTRWLTTNEYAQPLGILDGPLAPQTSTGAIMYGPVDQAANGCWVTRHVVDVIQLAGDGSNYWTLQLQSRPASGAASNVGGTVVTNGYTNGNRVRTQTTVGAAVNSAHADFMLLATETGSAASLYAMIVVYYRLIG